MSKAEAPLSKQECPMKGRHMTAMHRDACQICNPKESPCTTPQAIDTTQNTGQVTTTTEALTSKTISLCSAHQQTDPNCPTCNIPLDVRTLDKLVVDGDTLAEIEQGTGDPAGTYMKYRGQIWVNDGWLDDTKARALRDWLTAALSGSPSAPETKAPSCHTTVDGAWKEFLQNTSSDRTTWEVFQYAWVARGELDPTWAQLEAQCQAIWRTNVTLVCQLAKGHQGAHSSGRHTWNGEVDTKASVEETSVSNPRAAEGDRTCAVGGAVLPGQPVFVDAARGLGPSQKASTNPERVPVLRCRCGGFPRPTIMGRTICSVCGDDIPQPAPV